MSVWIRCKGRPVNVPDRVDVSFYDDLAMGQNIDIPEFCVASWDSVKWWRPAAGSSAALPPAESPREVNEVHPDDAEPSREPVTVPHTQQFDAYASGNISVESVSLDASERAFEEAYSIPLTGPEYGDALRSAIDLNHVTKEPAFTLVDSPVEKSFAVIDTLQERGARYGDFTDNAEISQALKQCMGNQMGWGNLNAVQREALEMIAQKIARILNGDPNYRDNWHDIQGYARLAEERCREQE